MSDAATVDITSHDTYVEGVPHEEFARLRREDPVSWTEEPLGGRGFWSLTKHEDVLYASRHSNVFSSAQGIRLEDMTAEETEARRTLMEMDAPEHTRLRRLVNRPFSPRAVAEYEESIRSMAVDVLDELAGLEEFDFVRSVARQLPMKMLGRLLGLPDEDLDWLVNRGDALIGNTDPEFTDFVVDQTDTAEYHLLPFRSPVSLELFAYAEQALAARRLSPTDDVLTALLETTIEGDTLDDLALKNFFTLMVAAGNDTTRYTITAGMQLFLERPELLDAWLTMDLPARKAFVEEVLRWATTTMHFRRTLTEDVELRGRSMKKGDKVVLWYVAANFDEDVFAAATEFRSERSPNPHLAFGLQSPHLCLGAHLARLELRVMFEELARAWSQVEPAGDPERFRSNFISGTKRLPLRVTWR
jgi:cytochrome P450